MTSLILVFALALSGVSVFLSSWALASSRAFRISLHEEKLENEKLTHALLDILDDDGSVRGQLAIPGQLAPQAVSDRLQEAKSLLEEARSATKALQEAKSELEDSRKREHVVAEVIDKDGAVLTQLRIPGRKVQPNRTPCGSCGRVYWIGREVMCGAARGEVAGWRPHFLGSDNQCIHFISVG
jgi:hypothetical protein